MARKIGALVALVTLLVTMIFPMEAEAGAKRRIAIMPFEYGSVSGIVGTYDVGKGIVSLLVTKLVNDGTYSVIERQMLDSLLKEQNFSVSDRADPTTACKIGKMLSVDALVVGTVTQFGFESKSTNVGAPVSIATGYIPYVGGIGSVFGGLSVRKSKARCGIDARVIDVNTGEVLASVHGFGESKRGGSTLGIIDCDSSGFETSIAGEATMQAVESVGGQLIAMANRVPDNQSVAQKNVEGKIADVTGTQVIVNVGKINGLAPGDNLQVDRAYKTVKDPDTGRVIKELTNTIAIVTLRSVDSDSAQGDVTKGSGVKVGDVVKKVTTDVSAVVITPIPDAIAAPPNAAPPKATMTTTGTVMNSKPTKAAGGK